MNINEPLAQPSYKPQKPSYKPAKPTYKAPSYHPQRPSYRPNTDSRPTSHQHQINQHQQPSPPSQTNNLLPPPPPPAQNGHQHQSIKNVGLSSPTAETYSDKEIISLLQNMHDIIHEIMKHHNIEDQANGDTYGSPVSAALPTYSNSVTTNTETYGSPVSPALPTYSNSVTKMKEIVSTYGNPSIASPQYNIAQNNYTPQNLPTYGGQTSIKNQKRPKALPTYTLPQNVPKAPPTSYTAAQSPPSSYTAAQSPPSSYTAAQSPPTSYQAAQSPPNSYSAAQSPTTSYQAAHSPPTTYTAANIDTYKSQELPNYNSGQSNYNLPPSESFTIQDLPSYSKPAEDSYSSPVGDNYSSPADQHYENDDIDNYITSTLDRMIDSLSAYRYNTDHLDEYEDKVVRRRRKNEGNKVETDMPKIRAILAILQNRRIDDPEAETLKEMYEKLQVIENEKKISAKEGKSLQIDTFFK